MDIGLSGQGEGPKIRLLIVEDDISLRDQLEEGLHYCGFDTMTASDGFAARAITGNHPDLSLILTDMDMPGMTGLELARHVLADRRAAVVILTGKGLPRLEQEAEDAGVFAVLRKPIRLPALAETLRQALASLRETGVR